jgi:hypothetical protein
VILATHSFNGKPKAPASNRREYASRQDPMRDLILHGHTGAFGLPLNEKGGTLAHVDGLVRVMLIGKHRAIGMSYD